MKDRNRRIWPYIEPSPISPLVLDNLGITIPLGNLESWEEFRTARNRLFGTNWLSRFWAGRIYPVLKPKGYQARKERFEVAQNRSRQEFLCAILDKAKAAEE